MHRFSAVAIALLARTVYAVGDWQQCGGINYQGETTCLPGSGCMKLSDYYSQCVPGAPAAVTSAAPAPTSAAPAPTTLTTSVLTSTPAASAPAASGTPSTPAPGTPAGAGPGTTLQDGYLWIRAVEAPNFHKYLQSKPLYATGPARIDLYTQAGQFNIVDGQLVQLVSAPGASAQILYAVVDPTPVINGASLAVSFSTSKNTYGTFSWGGDALQWSVAGVNRPNLSAWYVCGGQQLYINLGNYLYMTPAGCADETIHYYNDKTANN